MQDWTSYHKTEQRQDWQKRHFPPFLLPQPPHTFRGKRPLWQNEDGWLAVRSANTRLAFQKTEGILRKLVNPHKDTDRFVLHLIDIKREFRMTEQGDEWNVNTLVRYFGPTFPVFLIFSSGMFNIALLQWSLTSSAPRQTEQHFWWHLIYSHKTYYSTYTVNLNFCCWCVTARESTFSSSAWVPEVLLPSLLSEKTSLKYKFNDLTGATVQLLLLSSSSVYAFHPQLQIAQGI